MNKRKGIRIESCPRCNKSGLLIRKKTTTRKGANLYIYEKWYIAHYLPNGISKSGKRVNRVQWCYISEDNFKKITQTLTQTSQKDCVTKNPDSQCFSAEKPRAGFDPATAALPRRCPTRLGYRGMEFLSEDNVRYEIKSLRFRRFGSAPQNAPKLSESGSTALL